MSKELTFTYGDDTLKLNFEESVLAGDMLRPKPSSEKLNDEELMAMIDKSLQNPEEGERLCNMVKDKSVSLIISDEFRAGLQPLILESMLLEINSGSPSRIGVFVATGSHDPEYYCSNTRKFFKEICDRHDITAEIFEHDCDNNEHVFLGKTSEGSEVEIQKEYLEFEVRTYGHESKHHYMNGYSVVDKQVLPGVASRESIAQAHKGALQSDYSLAGRICWHSDPARHKNPFAQANADARILSERFLIRDGALLEEKLPTFALDMISTKTSIDWISSGDPNKVCNRMTAAADELAAFEVEKTDYVVISPGGPPACNALYGVQNCFDMALKGAIKEGGEALVLAPCLGREGLPADVNGLAPDGKSKILFWDNLCRFMKMPLQEALDYIDENFELYLWKTDRVLKLMRQANIKLYLYSSLPAETLAKGGITAVSDPQAWIDERTARNNGKIRTIDDGNKMLVIGK